MPTSYTVPKLSIREIISKLNDVDYIASHDIAYAASGTINERIPLLIEGQPGQGKTQLAKAVAKMLGLELIRVQMYDGITPDKIMYDYDYQRQLLTIEAIRSTLDGSLNGKTPEEAIQLASGIDFYGKQFLIRRPILRALTSDKPVVLLLDEVDKTSEELEYALLEVLDEFSMTIPQYGTIRCKPENRPLVFLTSNNYRELSDAMKRRCNYLYISEKTQDEICEIIKKQTNLSANVADGVAACLAELQKASLRQKPSIAEGIAWANYVTQSSDVTGDTLKDTAFLLAKDQHDTGRVQVIIQKHKEILSKEEAPAKSNLRVGRKPWGNKS